MTKVAFVDCETTGLNPAVHEIWEFAAIIREDGQEDQEHCFQIEVDESRAHSRALEVGHWDARRIDPRYLLDKPDAAMRIGKLLEGAIVVGANPAFDVDFLARLLRVYGVEPSWHYRPVCVEVLAAGWLIDNRDYIYNFSAPWKSGDLADKCGVPPARESDRHTALGDARWVRDWFDKITGGR